MAGERRLAGGASSGPLAAGLRRWVPVRDVGRSAWARCGRVGIVARRADPADSFPTGIKVGQIGHRMRLEKTDAALRFVLRDDAQCYAAGIRPRLEARKVVAALEDSQPAADRRAALLHAVEAARKRSEQAESRPAGLLPVGLREFF